MTVEEYLDWEEAESVRHELVAGETYAMWGATRPHNEISLNIASLLRLAARTAACRTYIAAVRLRIGDDVVYYPDVTLDQIYEGVELPPAADVLRLREAEAEDA